MKNRNYKGEGNMFTGEHGWYKRVLKGYIGLKDMSMTMDNILNQLTDGNEGTIENISSYLRSLWKKGSYDIVIKFMVNIASQGINYEKIDTELTHIKGLITVVEVERKKAYERGYYSQSLVEVAEIIYTKDITGLNIDLDNITKQDIDNLASVTNTEYHYALYLPMFRKLMAENKIELMWYTFNNYIVDSLQGKNDFHAEYYLNHYFYELLGELQNIVYVEDYYTDNHIGSKKDHFREMFELWKSKETIKLKEYRDNILINNRFKEKYINYELLDSILKLYEDIKQAKTIEEESKEEITYIIALLMLHFNKTEDVSQFIYENSKYYTLTSLDKLGLLAITAIELDNFEQVNMLYGIFLTEKTFVSNLEGRLDKHIEDSVKVIKELREQFNRQKPGNLYEKSLNGYTGYPNQTQEQIEKCKQIMTREVESFRDKFFDETGAGNLIENCPEYPEVGEKLELCEQLNLRLKAIFDTARISSKITGSKINFVTVTLGHTTAIDTEGYIETSFIPRDIKQKCKDLYNKYRSIGLRINNIKHKNYYGKIQEVLSEKLTILYMENMSDIVEGILKETPDKYKQLFIKEWNEQEAEQLFIYNYTNHKETSRIKSYLEKDYTNRNYKETNPFAKIAYEDFVNYYEQSYNDGDDTYKDILLDKEIRKLMLTAEWLWDKETVENAQGMEYTYLVANYLKIVEVYLVKRIARALTKANIKFKQYELNKMTLGNLYHEVANNPNIMNDDLLEKTTQYLSSIDKSGNYKESPVFKYLKDFTNNIRNGYFHKHLITSYAEAEKIRHSTLYVIRRITIDFR